MVMFATQLNAEMVYCILKGITKFARVTFDPENDNVADKDFYRFTLNEVIPDYSQ